MAIYRNFATPDELNRQYSPRLILGEAVRDAALARYAQENAKVRAELRHEDDVPYGSTAAEHFDFYPAEGTNAPVHVFLHGGYWRAFSSKDFAYVAAPMRAAELATVIVNYALCPSVRIGEIVGQCRSAVASVWRNASSMGLDRNRITISGSSAGGHLSAMVLATDWGREGLPGDVVKAACLISGLYDLSPFPHTFIQSDLRLDEEEVAANSPVRHSIRARCPIVVAVGADESGEFHRQSEEYAAHAMRNGLKVDYLDVPGRNHFDIIEDFRGPGRQIFDAFRRL